jgi:hypothetical protein
MLASRLAILQIGTYAFGMFKPPATTAKLSGRQRGKLRSLAGQGIEPNQTKGASV